MKYIIGYLIVMNIIGLIVMRQDKKRAIRGKYRISEKSLFSVAIAGGSLGVYAGMYCFRHKTKHWYFKFGIPLIVLVQIIISMKIL